MNCAFEPIDEYRPDGRQKVRCKRCGHVGSLPRTGNPADNLRTCRAWPEGHELGFWSALVLEALTGLNKLRYLWFKEKLGLTPDCGCAKREEQLNTLGTLLRRLLSARLK